MEIVKTIIHPGENYTHDEEKLIPEASVWFREMDSLYRTFLLLSCGFTSVVVILAAIHLYHVIKYVSNERIQTDLYYLVFMYPVTTTCSVIGMFIPRAAIFLYAVALVYFMFCLFIIITLLFNIFGCRNAMAAFLRERRIKISLKVPPLCCFDCLPRLESTDKNLRRIEWLVFQTPILRTALELTNVVVFMELGHRHNLWFMFSQLFGLISMCVAFYGCYVMVPLGRAKHAPYRFDFIFRTVDIAQCIYTIQKFVFDFAASMEFIKPDRILTAGAKAQFWASFMLTWEMMLLSALSTYFLRPTKSVLFDKYPVADPTTAHHSTGSSDTIGSSVDPVEADNVEKGFQSRFDDIAVMRVPSVSSSVSSA